MALFDDEPVNRTPVHVLGQNLSELSVDDLEERIGQLRAEIDRLENEMTAKGSSRLAAEAFFRRG